MPLGNFSGLTQEASLGQVMDYLYRVQKELDYLTSTLETDNINRLDAKVLQLGTLDVNNVTVKSSLTGTSYIQMDATGFKAYNGTINTFEIDTNGKAYFRDTIEGAQIISDSSINVSTDLYVGDNIYLGNGVSATKTIQFNSGASISSQNLTDFSVSCDNMQINSSGALSLGTTGGTLYLYGTVNFNTAKTTSLAGGHNHGIPQNAELLYGHYDSTTSTWVIDGSYSWSPIADHDHTFS